MFGFTPDEKKAVIFLTAAFVAGTAILVYKKSHPGFAPGLKSVIAGLPTPRDSGAAQSLSADTLGSEEVLSNQSQKYFPAQRVNINRASQQALEKLPNIGPAMARRIVDYRAAQGGFKKADELRKVRGIGPKRLSQLIEHVTVGP
ncbi:helix-hairpin-helix domain-containing protein [candidate division TA06 bacterium]|uniref:Helix-hairpin-helix domain-containing protein n=1 Tax=candidate division TA06 bacterium TaxID=2250710 RepID=A0A933ML11_UNCT6|nr:helix-hairpin-helix domain-containing protein [candidate division TA06 bacterium]